jgi:hypothetical protein
MSLASDISPALVKSVRSQVTDTGGVYAVI